MMFDSSDRVSDEYGRRSQPLAVGIGLELDIELEIRIATRSDVANDLLLLLRGQLQLQLGGRGCGLDVSSCRYRQRSRSTRPDRVATCDFAGARDESPCGRAPAHCRGAIARPFQPP